jgi:hypothetical protein
MLGEYGANTAAVDFDVQRRRGGTIRGFETGD